MPRVIAGMLLSAIFFGWLYAALLPWRADQLAEAVKSGAIPAHAVPPLLWADEAPRLAAQNLLWSGSGNEQIIDDYLQRSIIARPLYAPTWLNRAELALRMGDRQAADHYGDVARSLWPTRRQLLWRLAMFRIRLGDQAKALGLLRDYLHAYPGDVFRAATVARRLESDPAKLVSLLLPASAPVGREAEYYLVGLLGFSLRIKDASLAHTVWQRLPERAKKKESILYPYINFMIALKLPDLAISAWNQLRDSKLDLGRITNPGFEEQLANGGFGWRYQEAKGAQLSRDKRIRYQGAYSLHIKFDGSENIRYHHINQTIPVEPSGRYRLSGYWRGGSITTRSGVFIDAYSLASRKNSYARTDAKRSTWDWELFELQIPVPEDSHFIGIRVVRNSTDALDRLISGDLWLDDLQLESVEMGNMRASGL